MFIYIGWYIYINALKHMVSCATHSVCRLLTWQAKVPRSLRRSLLRLLSNSGQAWMGRPWSRAWHLRQKIWTARRSRKDWRGCLPRGLMGLTWFRRSWSSNTRTSRWGRALWTISSPADSRRTVQGNITASYVMLFSFYDIMCIYIYTSVYTTNRVYITYITHTVIRIYTCIYHMYMCISHVCTSAYIITCILYIYTHIFDMCISIYVDSS